MIRRLPAFVVVSFALGACGGDGTEEVTGEVIPTAGDVVAEPGAGSETASGGAGTGTITVGGTTWDVVADVACLDYDVAMGLQGHAADDPGISVVLNANVDEPTAAYATVDSGDDFQWQAGEGYEPLGATVPETSIEDGTGRGTATFVDTLSGPDYVTADGSWEFSC